MESSVLFVSIMKWLFLVTCAGVLIGLSTTVFLKALGFSISAASGYSYYYLLLPSFVAGIVAFQVSSALGITYFFVGATAGNLFGSVLGLDVSVFSAIGMIALLAGAANTPISASIMAIELFCPAIGPYAAVACIISFLMTGHRSVYPS